MTNKFKFILAAALAATSLASTPAQAQGVPVVDPGNIAQTVKVVQNGVQQVQQMRAQLEQMTNIKDTLGKVGEGAVNSILQGANLDLDQDNMLGQLRQTIPGILDGLPNSQIGQKFGITSQAAQKARTSITAGREFALSTFYNGSNATVDDVTNRRGIREAAMRDSAAAGFATSVVMKTRLGEAEGTIKSLNERMAASTDLRTDVQVNSAVTMANLQQLVIQNQILAQLLEVNSTGNMGTNINSNN